MVKRASQHCWFQLVTKKRRKIGPYNISLKPPYMSDMHRRENYFLLQLLKMIRTLFRNTCCPQFWQKRMRENLWFFLHFQKNKFGKILRVRESMYYVGSDIWKMCKPYFKKFLGHKGFWWLVIIGMFIYFHFNRYILWFNKYEHQQFQLSLLCLCFKHK